MYRVGFGYDSHRFAAGRPLLLGGVRITSDRGLAGHSDADAVLHAVTDAILGGLGAGDIGELFPDADPRWRGADSSQFVRHAMTLARQHGCAIVNCDVTVITEQPKLSAHKEAMRANIAGLLDVAVEAVSVKAKTNEGIGLIGRGEGLAAMATVLLAKPDAPEPRRGEPSD